MGLLDLELVRGGEQLVTRFAREAKVPFLRVAFLVAHGV